MNKEIDIVPKDSEMYFLTELFKTLGDPTRVRIMFLLTNQELSVGAIAKKLSITESAVSHQIKVLKSSHLVTGRREGKNIYYVLADAHAKELITIGREHILEK